MHLTQVAFSQPRTDTFLFNILSKNTDTSFTKVFAQPKTYRLQIIYTQINRDAHNQPVLKNYFFNYDPELYFNPASMVKMPLAFLSLEKLNGIRQKGVDKYAVIQYDSSQPWQSSFYRDSSSENAFPSVAHFIKRAFLISENDPYNRMYQFMGQGNINRLLKQKGYGDARITRQFLGLSDEQNRYTNQVRFIDSTGGLIYKQEADYKTDSFHFPAPILIGDGYMNSRDSLVHEPFDFTRQNNLSLLTLQQLLQSVLFPKLVKPGQRFNLTEDDYSFLYRYLSQYPSETNYPKYDTGIYYDSYVKFFFRNDYRKMPANVRVFNKVGWSYGFATDVSYVVDFKNKIEFMLAATLYVNSDGIINDDKYDYETIGQPFLYQLGQTIYQYELKRKRKYIPNLSRFKIKYETRNPLDKRPVIGAANN